MTSVHSLENWARMSRVLTEAVAAAEARIALCHEVVACPKCGAGVGVQCWNMRGIAMPGHVRSVHARHTKHPHQERWAQIVPPR